MISIVCVYNNKEILENYLLKSLRTQSVEYELILIDNTNGMFKSAAEALNYGGKKVKSTYIMFVHQDIELEYNYWLRDAEKNLNSLENLGIAGIAGCNDNKKEIFTNIKAGIPVEEIIGVEIKAPKIVQTLDECLFIIPKSIFNKIQFDEISCQNWHLYAVDYCLTIKRYHKNVFVIPLSLYHVSNAYSFSNDYYSTLKKISKKHRKYFKKISTTMGIWSTNPILLQVTIILNNVIRKYNKNK
jgi:hypothetical protein